MKSRLVTPVSVRSGVCGINPTDSRCVISCCGQITKSVHSEDYTQWKKSVEFVLMSVSCHVFKIILIVMIVIVVCGNCRRFEVFQSQFADKLINIKLS